MDEMDISDIPVFIEAYEKKKREEMEASRLWTFLSVAPHIDTKKIRSVEDFFLFPWEIEGKKKKAEAEMNANTELFGRFMSGEFTHLLNN